MIPFAPVVKSDPTRGDLSPAAAGGVAQPEVSTITFTTPAARDLELLRQGDVYAVISGVQTLAPPENPDKMWEIVDLSAFLAPIIAALNVGIYQTGWSLSPILDLTLADAEIDRRIREALEFERSGGDFEEPVKVDKRDLKVERRRLQIRCARERQFLEAYFKQVCPGLSWEQLRAILGQDLEVTGNGYLEVLRDVKGRPARLSWVPSRYIRVALSDASIRPDLTLVPDAPLVPYWQRVQFSQIRWATVPQQKRFSRYVQISGGIVNAFFKEYGDPRVMSRATGKYYEGGLQELVSSPEEIGEAIRRSNGAQFIPAAATELLHFKIPYGGSTYYGKPEHSPAYPHLVGGRDLSEENMRVVADESIPSMIVLCSGGRVNGEDQKRIEDKIRERKRGRKRILFLNAVSASTNPTGPTMLPVLKIEHTKPLQQTDALFMKYEQRVEEVTHGTTRTPLCMTGRATGITKQTLLALRRFFDEDVCGPRRRLVIDAMVNTQLLPDLGIECWQYRSNDRPPTDPEALVEMLSKAMGAGWITPDDARRLSKKAFDAELPDLPGVWSELTTKIVIAVLQTKNPELAKVLLGNDPKALEKASQVLAKMLEEPEIDASSTSVEEGQDGKDPGQVGAGDADGDGDEGSESGDGKQAGEADGGT